MSGTSNKCLNWWQNMDQLGIITSLNYKKQPVYQTCIGGFVSCLAITLIIIYFLNAIILLIASPEFNQSIDLNHIEQSINSVSYNLNSSDFIIAMQLVDTNEHKTKNLSDIVQIQYYQLVRVDGVQYNYMVPKGPCDELLSDINSVAIEDAFTEKSWTCPNTTSIDLYNNVLSDPNGKGFFGVINYCSTAEPDNPRCHNSTSKETQLYMNNVFMNSKILSQYFNPQEYEAVGRMRYFTSKQNTQGLVSLLSSSTVYSVAQTTIAFFPQRFINLSSFTFLNFATSLVSYSVADSNYEIYNDFTANRFYGLYSITFTQSTKIVSESYVAFAFDNIMAEVGGFSAFLWMFLGLIIGSYQMYSYQNSVIEQLYIRQKKQRDMEVINANNDEDELAASILYKVPQKISCMEWFIKGWNESCFCCCCRESCCKRYHQTFRFHNEALDRLSRELDLLDFIEASRVTNFMSSIYLHHNQRLMVPYFRKYFLNPDNLRLPSKNQHRLADLITNVDLVQSKIDRRILYEITGRKKETEIYSDESEFNNDEEHSKDSLMFASSAEQEQNFNKSLNYLPSSSNSSREEEKQQ